MSASYERPTNKVTHVEVARPMNSNRREIEALHWRRGLELKIAG